MSDVVLVDEKELTVPEQLRLKELEKVIKDNFLGFVAVGNALAEIRDKRLYIGTHTTFEGYCRELWDMSHQRADQLVAAKNVIENLTTIVVKNDDQDGLGLLPQNEAQARELARLEPKEQVLVWSELVRRRVSQASDNGTPKITAIAVKKAVKKYKGEVLQVAIGGSSKEMRQNRKDFQSEEFITAWESFWAQVDRERLDNWRYTSRQAVMNKLKVLMELVAGAGSQEFSASVFPAAANDQQEMRA